MDGSVAATWTELLAAGAARVGEADLG